MLQIQNAYPGSPSAGLQHLLLPQGPLILYPSAGVVNILDARTLAVIRVLAFWEAFPGLINVKDSVKSLSVDSGMKLIVAAMNSRMAAWSLSGVQQDAWRIHSTLVLPDQDTITALDNKAGVLAVGHTNGLSIYSLVLENDLPTWSEKWTVRTVTPNHIKFAPSLMYIATVSDDDHAIRLFSTTSGRMTQLIPHPRPVINLTWRHSQLSSRDDLILYSITSDSTLRIFLPVLDSPEHLQLHASLDLFSSMAHSTPNNLESSGVFWLDRDLVVHALANILKNRFTRNEGENKKIHDIKEGGWDLFFRSFSDGSLAIEAVANLDSKPPTLLRHFTLRHLQPLTFVRPPSYLYAFLISDTPNSMVLVTSAPLTSYTLDPMMLFDTVQQNITLVAQALERVPAEESEVLRFIRTPEGKGVAVIRANGGGEAWRIMEHGTKLLRSGHWSEADFVVPLDRGRTFATYSKADACLTYHAKVPQNTHISNLESLFTLPSPSGYELVIGVTADFSIIQLHATESEGLVLQSKNSLPLKSPPKHILPVDPMAWGLQRRWTEHDVLLSISEYGELSFWVPELSPENGWRCTGKVRTGRTGIKKARCSSAKKTALVVSGSEGDELTIWDSTESEFATGLEYRGVYCSEPVLDLDWTSTPDMQSILAVGFQRRVDILCQQRMTYFDEGPGWGLCWKIDLESITPYPINDSIWLDHGSFLVASNHQMFLYGEPRNQESVLVRKPNLFEHVAAHNGPLEDYHPQMLLQCLLWDKIGLVKQVISNLARNLFEEKPKEEWTPMPISSYFQEKYPAHDHKHNKKQYNLLFNRPVSVDEGDEEGFSRPLVNRLIEFLEAKPLPNLTPNEQAHLLVLLQATLEIDEQRRALDSNGLRYLISMRSFYIINHRVSASTSPPSKGAVPRQTGRRERLRYRDMIWAFHSESQEMLLAASVTACNGKMSWPDARALGISIWLKSIESLKSQLEIVARNEYMAGDVRDPTTCSLLYFAVGKSKLVHGLWRQAAWHREQAMMLKFLNNDFTDPRWRTAALKNAYALLSKRRFEYAAAFFMLGNSLKDAVNVCIKQLGDFQLAIALARVAEQSNDGPVLREILSGTVLPIAFELGNRWLGSWAFWLLHRRDLAVRIVLTPLQDIAAAFNITVTEIGEPHYDDPSLALLFSQLRSKTLQAAKGTSEISGRAEFNFVLQMSRIFCRMGCHALALDLVRSWSFERPSTNSIGTPVSPSVDEPKVSSSPTISRRSLFPLEPAIRRRSSILIDMDILSLPATQSTSPDKGDTKKTGIEVIKEESDLFARKAGLGNLMKTAKQDVKIPDFDMNAFF